MESNNENVIRNEKGEVIFEFKGEEVITLTEEEERKINSFVGAKGAICMDGKTILTPSNKSIDYGPVKDIAGNVVEPPPVDEKLYRLFH